jgi:hypothetical protein
MRTENTDANPDTCSHNTGPDRSGSHDPGADYTSADDACSNVPAIDDTSANYHSTGNYLSMALRNCSRYFSRQRSSWVGSGQLHSLKPAAPV